MTSITSLTFPPFRLDLTTGLLWYHQQPHRQLRPQVVALLHYLFAHAGLVISKEELLTALWPGTIVSDGLLKTYIWEIRQALGEKLGSQKFIETIPRRGYRFIAEAVSSQPSVVSSGEQSNVRGPTSEVGNPHSAFSLVGRDTELAQLHNALAKARSGDRQIVCVTGEAGIGKTSLVDTFIGQAGADPQLWIARGQCVEQYGAGEAYLPILEALGRLGREAGKKRLLKVLRQCAPSWLVQLPSLIPTEERTLLEHSLRNVTQERMLRELTDALEVLTVEQPLLLVLEDLHWSDPSTVELLATLVRRQESARLFILGTYRPVDLLSHSHPLHSVAEAVHRHGRGAVLPLSLLSKEAVQEYLTQRFVFGAVSPVALHDVAQAIHQRTEGNPLFLHHTIEYVVAQESLVQHNDTWSFDGALVLLERAVPLSIQQLIERQLERLSSNEHRLLEVASVIGIEFSASIVAVTLQTETSHVEQWCNSLVRRHLFLDADSDTSRATERRQAARYRFQHSLYAQVLYNRLSPAQRRRLHQLVGTSLASIVGERSRELAGALANHFTQAHEYALAVNYYEQAAGKALQISAPQEAVAHLTKGLELLRLLPVTHERDQQELGLLFTLAGPLIATKGYTAPECEATFSRTRDLCRQTGDTYRLFISLLGVWGAVLVRGHIHHARQTAEELLQISHTIGDSGLQISAHMAIGMPLFYIPDLRTARSHLEQGIALYDRQQHSYLATIYGQDPGVTIHAYLAWTLWLLGYSDQALRQAEEARVLAEAIAHPYSQAFALMFEAWLRVLRREPQHAQERATAAMAVAAEHGFPYLVTAAKMSYGWARAAQGDTEDGVLNMREALERHQEKDEELGRPYDLVLLAQVHFQCGKCEVAHGLLDEARAVIERTGEHVYEAEIYRLKGQLVLASGVRRPASEQVQSPKSKVAEEAEGCFLKAIAIAQQQQAKSLELRALMSLVRLRQYQATQHATRNTQHVSLLALAEARMRLSALSSWFTEGFETADLQEAKALLSDSS